MYEIFERYSSRLLAVWGSIAAIVWLITSAKFVDGVDLYVFVCHARDMIQSVAPDPDSAYRYFPGIYSFWRGILQARVLGQDFPALQFGVIAVLAANAMLAGALSWRLAKSVPYGVLGGVLYLCIASRYEGLTGTAEPLATIPFLAGLLLWFLSSERKSGHWKSLLLLGVGLGFSVYCKQQAGLLAVGMAWWPVARLRIDAPWSTAIRNGSKDVAVIAVTALATLMLGILYEGKGLAPLQQGLQMAAGYSSQGTWLSNLYSVFRNDESVGLMAATVVIGLFTAARSPRETSDNSFALTGILCCAAIAATVQFRSRGYYHYFLLVVPCLITAFVFALSAMTARFSASSVRDRSVRAVIFLIGVLPFFHAGQRPFDFEVWNPVASAADHDEPRPWHSDPELSADILNIQSHLDADRQIVVLPPVRSVIYLLVSARQSAGYAFGSSSCLDNVNWDSLDAAVVLESMDQRETANWQEADCDSAMLKLTERGFRRTHRGTRLSLWERSAD